MIKTFNPGFTIIQPIYDQGSSGGNFIGEPDDPGVIYQDDQGRLYQYFDEDSLFATQGAGWYWFIEGEEGFTWYGTQIPADWVPLP